VRQAVAQTLGMLEPGTLAQHGATLVALLEDPYAGVRGAVMETLGKLEAVPTLQLGFADGLPCRSPCSEPQT
jgi:hypothetical protein